MINFKSPHLPVLLSEVVKGLSLKFGDNAVDATLGYGGHAEAVLKAIGSKGKLLGIDQDQNAINYCQNRFIRYQKQGQLFLHHGNFRYLGAIAEERAFSDIAGILFDLGVSSPQITDPGRGFSFQKEGRLDMRMSSSCSQRKISPGLKVSRKVFASLNNLEGYIENNPCSISAHEIVNNLAEKDLANLLWRYGEEKKSRKIARLIVEERKKKSIETTTELAKIIEAAIGRKKKIHPATRTFQALRIVVNRELKNLQEGLKQAIAILNPHGRVVVISFHSLEDRIVKDFFRKESQGCICPPNFPKCICGHKATLKIITKKPITPSDEEVRNNPLSRSAKLRIAEKM